MEFFTSKNHTLIGINSVIPIALKQARTGGNAAHRNILRQNTLCYKISGSSLHMSNGTEFLLVPGKILLLPRDVPYTVKSIEDGESIAIGFTLLDDDLQNQLALIQPMNTMKCRQLFRELLTLFTKNDHQYDCFRCFYEILSLCCIGNSVDNITPPIQTALEYIRRNYADPLLNEICLADLCGYSVGYFRRIFTEKVGKSPIKYIISVKMNHACTLLKSNFFTVTEIAEKLGYRDIYYFSNSFKREYGVSPSEYMRSYKIAENTENK